MIDYNIPSFNTMNRKKIIGFTHGDTNGVGYELILKAFSNAELFEACVPVVFGSEKILQFHQKALNLPGSINVVADVKQLREGVINVIDISLNEPFAAVDFGVSTEVSARLALRSLESAANAVAGGTIDALIVLPVSAAMLPSDVFPFRSQFAFLASKLDADALVLQCNSRIRVALPLSDTASVECAADVTSKILDRRVRQCYSSVSRDFLCSAPRVAVLGTGVHEDSPSVLTAAFEPLVTSVVNNLAESGVRVFGPYDSSQFVSATHYKHFDCVLAPTFNVAAALVNSFDTDDCVNLLLTPSAVCASLYAEPDFEAAGKGISSTGAMLHAIYQVLDLCRCRAIYDESHSNPLPFTSFHDRRDDRRDFRRDNRAEQSAEGKTHERPAAL